MDRETLALFNAHTHRILTTAQRFAAVDTVAKDFPVDPLIHDQFENRILERNQFLSQVQMIGIDQLKAEKVLMDIPEPMSKRTEITDSQKRKPSTGKATRALKPVQLLEWEFDPVISWQQMRHYAKRPDFDTIIQNMLATRMGNDQQLVGFQGADIQATVTPANVINMDKSWLLEVKAEKPTHYIEEIVASSGQVRITNGSDVGDYDNLDELVSDMLHRIPPEKRTADLVVLMADAWRGYRSTRLYEQHGGTPTERMAITKALSDVGGVPPFFPAYFLPDAIMITSLKNLAIYYLRSPDEGWIRAIENSQSEKAVIYWNHFYRKFVVQDPEACFVVRNIKTKKVGGVWKGINE